MQSNKLQERARQKKEDIASFKKMKDARGDADMNIERSNVLGVALGGKRKREDAEEDGGAPTARDDRPAKKGKKRMGKVSRIPSVCKCSCPFSRVYVCCFSFLRIRSTVGGGRRRGLTLRNPVHGSRQTRRYTLGGRGGSKVPLVF